MKRFRKGAASFYIVSFSTLILVIIAASFATVIISAVTRASNDDLSQSAYDAALAGVEDAKLAFANYQRCLQKAGITPREPDGDGAVTCEEILWWMLPDNADCDMVAHMIGRIPDYESGEVLVSDTTSTDGSGKTSDLNQAYTCVKISTVLRDYKANLSSTSNYRLVRVSLDKANAADIKKVKFGWYSVKEGQTTNFTNFSTVDGKNRVTFQPAPAASIDQSVASISQPPTPPTVQIQMVQTSSDYTMDEVNSLSRGDRTDRATLFLVPTEDETLGKEGDGTYEGVYDATAEKNIISASQVAKTNSQQISIKPYAVKCREDANPLCEVTIELPNPIGKTEKRVNDTFLFLVALPYGEPDTDFVMEFLCDDTNELCEATVNEVGGEVIENTAYTRGVQINIDSTGRANDLFRRVETRFESMDVAFPFIYYALQVLNIDGKNAVELVKSFEVEYEHNRKYEDL